MLVFGVDILDLNLGVQIDSVKRPIKRNSVGSGNMSHCWGLRPLIMILITGFIIVKRVQHRTKLRELRV